MACTPRSVGLAPAASNHYFMRAAMAITQQELGTRIRAAREASRMTQDEVAKHLGVSRPTVVQIEAGNRSVSSLELDRLAYPFWRDIREFVAESFQAEDTLAALFRAQPDVVEQPAVMEKLRECMALGRELTNLERLVGIDRDLTAVATYTAPAPRTRKCAASRSRGPAGNARSAHRPRGIAGRRFRPHAERPQHRTLRCR